MWTKVFPEYLMGKVDLNDGTYWRCNLICENKQQESIIKYDCGVFFAFKCQTKTLKIKTHVHFNTKFNYNAGGGAGVRTRGDLQILGKVNNSWELLNEVTPKNHIMPNQCSVVEYNLFGLNYDEFQVCLPVQGRIDGYLWIETDNKPEFIIKPLSAIFLGSSVAQDSNDTTHGNICCSLYRKLGINTATLGVSRTHTLTCPELLKMLKEKTNDQIKIIMMDMYHVSKDVLLQFKAEFKNVIYAPINSICREDVKKLTEEFPEIEFIHIDGNGRWDEVHLNCYGTQMYINELRKREIL